MQCGAWFPDRGHHVVAQDFGCFLDASLFYAQVSLGRRQERESDVQFRHGLCAGLDVFGRLRQIVP